MIKYDNQRPVQQPERKLPDKKQKHALTVCRTEQGKNRSQTNVFQTYKPDTQGRRSRRILHKKREKKK